jgi:uncharacterized membrane protein
MADRNPFRRFWLEAALAVLSAALGIATILWPTWTEVLVHVDPDQGNGTFEIAVTLGAFALAFLLMVAAWFDRRHHLAAAS